MKSFNQLRQSIICAAELDRALQRELAASGEWGTSVYHSRMRTCNEQNAAVLMDFLQQYGWPAPSKYGAELHEAAWWIAIHAISLPDVQRHVLKLLSEAYAAGEAVGPEYARLYDKVALQEGRPQRYGTQGNPSPEGWKIDTVEDPGKVEWYRSQVGLPTIQEMLRDWCPQEHYYNIPCECGGVVDATTAERFEREWIVFLHEVRWREESNFPS